MPNTVILHIPDQPSITGELEELPKATDNIIVITNPRQKDGKDLHYLENNVTKVIFPLAKVNFIEVLEGSEEDKIIGFVRE